MILWTFSFLLCVAFNNHGGCCSLTAAEINALQASWSFFCFGPKKPSATLKLVCCQPSIAWFRWIILYDVWWTLYIQLSIKWCAGWKRKIGPNNLKLGTEWTYSSSLDKYSMIKRIGKLLLIDGLCLFTWNRVENLSKLRLCVPLPSYFCLCIKSDLNFLFCFSCYVALDVYKLGRIQSKKTEEMIIDSGNTKISIYITPAYMVTHHHP